METRSIAFRLAPTVSLVRPTTCPTTCQPTWGQPGIDRNPRSTPAKRQRLFLAPDAPGRDILTTQLYFPGEPQNQRDDIFDQALLMDMKQDAGTKIGRYNFVLDLG